MTTAKNNKHTDVDRESLRLEYVFDKGINFRDRIIQVTGEIEDNSSFDWLDAALTEMERGSKKAITLKINSPGGSVYEALGMVGRLAASKCQIITEGYGQIMSAATLLLACGDKRRISKYAFFMHHEASYYVEGRHDTVASTVSQMEREERLWSRWMEEFSTQPAEFWYSKGKQRDFYLTAEECQIYGVVDEII